MVVFYTILTNKSTFNGKIDCFENKLTKGETIIISNLLSLQVIQQVIALNGE